MIQSLPMTLHALVIDIGQHHAGDVLDDLVDGDVAGLVQGGAVFIDNPNDAVLAAANKARQRRLKGDSTGAQAMMLAAYTQTKSGGGGGGIAWSPGGLGNAVTSADVKALVDASLVPTTVFLVEGGGVHYNLDSIDMKTGGFSATAGNADDKVLIIGDGAIVKNLGAHLFAQGAFDGAMKVQFTSTGADAPLQFDTLDGPGHFAPFEFGGGTFLENVGTRAAIDVPPAAPDSLLIVIAQNNATIGPGTAPIVAIGTGANCIVAMHQNVIATIDPSWVVGDATNLMVFLTDGFDFSTVAAWVGVAACTKVNQPFALDGGSGPTSFRPMGVFAPLVKGVRYYDQDIALPIWWSGTAWVDASGAPV